MNEMVGGANFVGRQVYEFFLLFLKVSLSNVVGFIWMLILPFVLFIWQEHQWFVHPPSPIEYNGVSAAYWGYMIVSGGLNGVGLSLLQMRESGFLKMYRFICGRTLPIVAAQILSLLLCTLLIITIFTMTTALMFHVDAIRSLLVAYIVCIVSIIPIGLFFCWIPALPTRVQSISPVLNIMIGPLLYFAGMYAYHSFSTDIEVLNFLNPVTFVMRIAMVLFSTFHILSRGPLHVVALLIVLLIYLVIGWFSYRHIRILSSVART
ncbi:hypothetical protein [Alicyclobacillus kakegawensis]|uniref:hypothetical protein n=1 Tax=Alicyclobacillus kakegawensis TaxID=392012 RepID=UPI0012EEB2CC|nr:hypothetical protein [Alicyclobacillus kakegawensis]